MFRIINIAIHKAHYVLHRIHLDYILACIFLINISACVKEVYVPVYSCPDPVVPVKQARQTAEPLTSTEDILKAMVYDIKYLDSYSDQLLVILNSYKKTDTVLQTITK